LKVALVIAGATFYLTEHQGNLGLPAKVGELIKKTLFLPYSKNKTT